MFVPDIGYVSTGHRLPTVSAVTEAASHWGTHVGGAQMLSLKVQSIAQGAHHTSDIEYWTLPLYRAVQCLP